MDFFLGQILPSSARQSGDGHVRDADADEPSDMATTTQMKSTIFAIIINLYLRKNSNLEQIRKNNSCEKEGVPFLQRMMCFTHRRSNQ
jgi:hypothetical protein